MFSINWMNHCMNDLTNGKIMIRCDWKQWTINGAVYFLRRDFKENLSNPWWSNGSLAACTIEIGLVMWCWDNAFLNYRLLLVAHGCFILRKRLWESKTWDGSVGILKGKLFRTAGYLLFHFGIDRKCGIIDSAYPTLPEIIYIWDDNAILVSIILCNTSRISVPLFIDWHIEWCTFFSKSVNRSGSLFIGRKTLSLLSLPGLLFPCPYYFIYHSMPSRSKAPRRSQLIISRNNLESINPDLRASTGVR